MPFTTTGLNSAADGIAAAGTWIAFHTADPAGVAGANQTGSRVQTTWAAASGGSRAGSQVSAAIGAGVTVSHWSINSASTAGNMIFSDQLKSGATPAPETFGSAGTIQHTPTVTVA